MKTIARLLLFGAVLTVAGSRPAAAQEAPETVVLKGPTQAAVTLSHKKHAELTECTSCHHEAKAEKAPTSANQKCGECHTKPPVEPMKTALRDAFHNAMAKQGTCVDCHVKAAAEGKTVPVKCAECHKKE